MAQQDEEHLSDAQAELLSVQFELDRITLEAKASIASAVVHGLARQGTGFLTDDSTQLIADRIAEFTNTLVDGLVGT